MKSIPLIENGLAAEAEVLETISHKYGERVATAVRVVTYQARTLSALCALMRAAAHNASPPRPSEFVELDLAIGRILPEVLALSSAIVGLLLDTEDERDELGQFTRALVGRAITESLRVMQGETDA